MKAQLLHLSGPYRGQTLTYTKPVLVLGTAADADIRYPVGVNVVERHAELAFVEEGCAFYLRALDGDVFVNRNQVEEVILSPDDLIELGVGGPKMRFRIQADGGPTCKPIRQMLRDAREVHGEGGLAATTRLVHHDMIRQSTWRRRASIPVGAAVIALLAAYLGGWLGSAQTAKRQEAHRQAQSEAFHEAIDALRDQMAAFRRDQAGRATQEEVDKLKADLARRSAVVDELAERNAALKKVLEVYSRGVCLLHGVFAFKIKQGDKIVAVVGNDGTPAQVEYMGSGFLVSGRGDVITNRHVAQPWWNNPAVEYLIQQGAQPGFVSLTAVFPGKAPIPVDPSTIKLSPDDVDVAVLNVKVEGVPVLPLHTGTLQAVRGKRVILLGYPTGLNAILARAEPDLVNEVLSTATDTTSLIAELARRDAISPVITQGALNEVRERRLVYDAETTSGGSGGPVFGADGTVIGVNFAITRDFDGSNFGIPIAFARKLLSDPAP